MLIIASPSIIHLIKTSFILSQFHHEFLACKSEQKYHVILVGLLYGDLLAVGTAAAFMEEPPLPTGYQTTLVHYRFIRKYLKKSY